MLNIAPSVQDCGQVWDVRSVESEQDWSCDHGMGCRWGSEFKLSRRERADTRQGFLLSMIHEKSSLDSVITSYICTKLPPLTKLTLLTVQLANPQEASQGLPVIALWAALRMLSAGAIGQWNFLLLRIWKWGKLIWNEICISTLAGKLLPTISSLD